MNFTRLFAPMRAAACAALFLLLSCFNHAWAAGYYTANGRIYESTGQEIHVRGISHFGFNALILQPQYLWQMGWKEQIAQIKSLGFNAVRLPFVPDTLYNNTPINQLSYLDPGLNFDLMGKTPLQAMDMWMEEANRVGLYVMMDFHSVSKHRQTQAWFTTNPADFGIIYNGQAYTTENWIRDLTFVAKRYAHLPKFMGIDLINEPYGEVRWIASNPAFSYKPAVESAASSILAANPNLLIFVQGISGNFDGIEDSTIPINWGEDLQPQAYQPLNVPSNKLVFVPHTYGPDVFFKGTFSAPNFPNNLPPHWEKLFGQFSKVHPVVPGEWGGRYGNGTGGIKDKQWQDAFVDYLISKGMTSSFYWCYTPNSGDTGGILDDNLQVRQDKMALLRRLWAAHTPTASPTPAPDPTPTPTPGPTPAPAPSAPPTLTFSANTTSVPKGGKVTLNWSTTNVFSCSASGLWGGPKAASGQQTVSYLNNSGTFFLTCFGAGKQVQKGVAITVTPAPAPSPAPTPAPTGFVQPMIDNFSPTSGSVGTVVTINGSGFTGLNQAWAGNSHTASFRVVSDKQVQVTIPRDATSGAIGLLNPKHAAFTAGPFTVR